MTKKSPGKPGLFVFGRLERLERQGLVTRGKKRLPKDFFDRPLPKAKPGGDILKALLADREESW